MPLTNGTRVGAYEITGSLGAGGMGEVYRARDTVLGRDVAIKILPTSLAVDPDYVGRFAREARLLAALNHRHVATIHGFEEYAGSGALVMELVEGPTLEQKLAQGGWRNDSARARIAAALTIAKQIADGLEAAHAKGIVHLDLKPANVKVSSDGAVKILDFGLAKALAGAETSDTASDLPTLTGTALGAGTIAGTPAYMSPEQARGEALNTRTDIWAFGCVLYEMLAGRRAFGGKTTSDAIAAVLERAPDWTALPVETPPTILRLVRRCLDKDPRQRLHDIADARIELDDAIAGRLDEPRVPAPPPARPQRMWTTALVAAALAAGAAAAWFLTPVPPTLEARVEINTEPTQDPAIAISPDGRTIAFVVRSADQPQLWLRSIDSLTPRRIPGTEHATEPFWSPDGRSVGFFAGMRLMRMDIDGGAVRTLSTTSAVPIGGTWNRDGMILFADNPGGPIMRVPAGGGEAVAETRVEMPQQRGHWYPSFLPDGRHFLFFVTGGPEARGIYVGTLGGAKPARLFDADGPAVFVASGYLLFVRSGKLLAQHFDPGRGEADGEAFTIDEHLQSDLSLTASAAGPFAYRASAPDTGQRQLVWFDRTGREFDKVVYADTAAQGPALSHDGRRIAVFRFANNNMDLWFYDVRRRTWDRVTSHPGDEIDPLWAPNDASIVYGAVRQVSHVDVYRRALAAPEHDEELLASNPGGFPTDWSRDGRVVLYSTAGPTTGADIRAVRLDGDRTPFDVVKTEFNEGLAQFSPDGKWIAYESDKTGHLEVYLRPFPGPGADVRASTDGGSQARWNPDGRELFYVAADDRLMSVPIAASADGRLEPGRPTALFLTNVGSTAILKYRAQYVVAPDGQSFVMNSVVGQGSASPIRVLLNWKPK